MADGCAAAGRERCSIQGEEMWESDSCGTRLQPTGRHGTALGGRREGAAGEGEEVGCRRWAGVTYGGEGSRWTRVPV